MRVVSNKFDVVCKDSQDNEHNLLCFSYDELGNEIYIETQVHNTELRRGWTGDLYYLMRENMDIETLDEYNWEIIEVYNDVLLANVTPSANCGEAIIWKYTFLKK